MTRRTTIALMLALTVLLGLPALVGADGDQGTWSEWQAEPYSGADVSDLESANLATSMSALTPTTTPTLPPPVDIRIKFEGVIKEIITGSEGSGYPQVWVIGVWGNGDVRVLVREDTEIDQEHGPAVPGAWVKVEAHLEPADNGSSYNIVADEIEVKRSPEACFRVELYGELIEIGTDSNTGQTVWIVSNHHGGHYRVIITDQTQIDGTPAVGAIVRVEGCAQPDGTVVALKVEVHRPPGQGGEEVEFRGCIVHITDTQWQVGRWTVLIISGETRITGGRPDVGDLAEVEGHLNDQHQVVAEEVKVKGRCRGRRLHVRIEGYITNVNHDRGVLKIQGIPIKLTDGTILGEIPPAVGIWAKADVIVQRPAASSLQQTDVIYVAVRVRTHRSDEPDNALKFTGMVDSINDGNWMVSGWPFVVPADTSIEHGPASQGDWVEIKAEAAYDEQNETWTYTAVEIEVKQQDDEGGPEHPDVGVKIKGRITAWDQENEQWAVEGIPIEVGPLTITDGRHAEIAEGVWVEVRAMAQNRGAPYLALAIKTDDEPDLDPGHLKFEGRLTNQEGTTWVVAGWPFLEHDETTFEGGTPVVGDRLEIIATRDGDTYYADVIKVEDHHEGDHGS